jgi:Uma2 family endonuclease
MVAVQPKSKAEEVSALIAAHGLGPLTLRLPSDWELTNEKLLELCSLNETVPFEVDETGALILNMPSGPTGEWMGFEIGWQIRSWADVEAGDLVFGSSALFELPDGNRRSPDIAWISGERLTGIDIYDGDVWRVSPDFVIEIRSLSDDVEQLQAKMERWRRNGVRLGWLVDPFDQRIWVYRPGAEAVLLERPMELSEDEVLPGLVVDLRRIWRPR